MYGILGMFFTSNELNINGYRISKVAEYYLRFSQDYRPAMDNGQGGIIPERYGTHIKTATANWMSNGPEPQSLFFVGTKWLYKIY